MSKVDPKQLGMVRYALEQLILDHQQDSDAAVEVLARGMTEAFGSVEMTKMTVWHALANLVGTALKLGLSGFPRSDIVTDETDEDAEARITTATWQADWFLAELYQQLGPDIRLHLTSRNPLNGDVMCGKEAPTLAALGRITMILKPGQEGGLWLAPRPGPDDDEPEPDNAA